MTQCEMVMRWLMERGSITTMDAYGELGVTRLAARVSDLKREGHDITGHFETRLNRYGEKVTYKRYTLNEEG